MIFGKTHDEKRAAEQEYLKKLKKEGVKKFAWRPVTLRNGKKVWFETYYVFYDIYENAFGLRVEREHGLAIRYNYLTQKEGQDALY